MTVNDVCHGLGAQWIVGEAPFMEAGFTSTNTRMEVVELTPLTSEQVEATDVSRRMMNNSRVHSTARQTSTVGSCVNARAPVCCDV